jgi:nicotinamidase-related amidase
MRSRAAMIYRLLLASGILLAAASATVLPAAAQTVIEEWYSAQIPPPPPVRPVTVDAKTTALLLMDFNRNSCDLEHRIRCGRVLPNLAKLLAEARVHGLAVVHVIQQSAKAADIPAQIAPISGEPVFQPSSTSLRWLSKFDSDDVVKYLRDRGIKTVILTGTSAISTGLFAVGGAADKGFKSIVPVDGMPADTIYQEQFVMWDIANGAVLKDNATLTKLDMIRF